MHGVVVFRAEIQSQSPHICRAQNLCACASIKITQIALRHLHQYVDPLLAGINFSLFLATNCQIHWEHVKENVPVFCNAKHTR